MQWWVDIGGEGCALGNRVRVRIRVRVGVRVRVTASVGDRVWV